MAVASAKAREFGFDTFACASTGNLASAVAAAGLRVGLKTFVFLPWDTEQSKILNALVYGATLVAVRGTYDDVNRLCSEIADQRSWAFCNINVRPYYSEGSKTLAFETAEQLGWEAPDHVVVPIASGSLLTKITKGFDELGKIGLIAPKAVRVSGAQAAGCNPVASAFEHGWEAVKPVQRPDTIAKSLAIGNPADGYNVLRIVRERGGAVRDASNEEIAEGMRLLAVDRRGLRRDGGRGDRGGAAEAGPGRGRAPRRAGGGLHHRQRPEDPGRRGPGAARAAGGRTDSEGVRLSPAPARGRERQRREEARRESIGWP